VLAFTPEVAEARAWFDQTHEIEAVGLAGAQCRIVRLPNAGALEDQDGLLWEALSVLRRVENQILQEQAKKSKPS